MAKYSKIPVEVPSEFNEKFISESGYYDVQGPNLYVPDVKAADSDEAIEQVASSRNVPVASLEVFEASNPSYREV